MGGPRACYDSAVIMLKTQITLDPELQRIARRRAGDLGISLAEYVRRLVVRDLGGSPNMANPALVFDLGNSGGSNIAGGKDALAAEALASSRASKRRRRSAFTILR